VWTANLSARHRREPGEEQVADAGLKVFRVEQIGGKRGQEEV